MGMLVWLIVILEVHTLFICSLLDQTAASIHAMQYKWHFLTQICEGYPRSKPLSHYANSTTTITYNLQIYDLHFCNRYRYVYPVLSVSASARVYCCIIHRNEWH